MFVAAIKQVDGAGLGIGGELGRLARDVRQATFGRGRGVHDEGKSQRNESEEGRHDEVGRSASKSVYTREWKGKGERDSKGRTGCPKR